MWNSVRAGAVSGRVVHLDRAATAILFGGPAVAYVLIRRNGVRRLKAVAFAVLTMLIGAPYDARGVRRRW